MMEKYRANIFVRNKLLFHFINVMSFIATIFFMPWIKTSVSNYLNQELFINLLTYLIMYILAIYVFPYISYFLASQNIGEE